MNKEQLCAIIVYDFVPELMPHRALRRAKHYDTAGKKEVKCPYCGKVLTVVDVTAKLELFRYPKRDRAKVNWDKSVMCRACNGSVGIIYQAV